MPLWIQAGIILNFIFVSILLGSILFFFQMVIRVYESVLRWYLENKMLFLSMPLFIVIVGMSMWLGFDKLFGFMPNWTKSNAVYSSLSHTMSGFGKEFILDLVEGSFLYMPTTMPHASIGEALSVLQTQDKVFNSILEIESAVGKLGRVESPLDSAPISMIETVISIIFI